MPLATPWAVTQLCCSVACWCTLNGARCTKRLANQPSSPSSSSQVTALTPWLPILVCCMQSAPATPVTHCSCQPTTTLSLVGSTELPPWWHWGCPRPPSLCTGYEEGARSQHIRLEQAPGSRPRGPQKARPLVQWHCSQLPADPRVAFLQCPLGDDRGDMKPTINFAVSLDWYWTLFCPPNWHSCPQHAFAIAFSMSFLF